MTIVIGLLGLSNCHLRFVGQGLNIELAAWLPLTLNWLPFGCLATLWLPGYP